MPIPIWNGSNLPHFTYILFKPHLKTEYFSEYRLKFEQKISLIRHMISDFSSISIEFTNWKNKTYVIEWNPFVWLNRSKSTALSPTEQRTNSTVSTWQTNEPMIKVPVPRSSSQLVLFAQRQSPLQAYHATQATLFKHLPLPPSILLFTYLVMN